MNIWKTRLDCGVGVKVNMIPKGWDASAPSVQLREFWEKYGFYIECKTEFAYPQ